MTAPMGQRPRPGIDTAGRIGDAPHRPRAGGDPVRVILVGQTGFEGLLRTDPSIELIRAATPVDAIGELADPLDDLSPKAATVVLGPAAVHGDKALALAEALRLVQSDVRILGMNDQTAGTDGRIDPSMSARELHAALRAPVLTSQPAQDAQAPAPTDAPAGDEAIDNAPPATETPADRQMLAALLSGKDATATALAIVSARLNAQARVVGPADTDSENVQHAAPLLHNGKAIGRLFAPGVDARSLAAQADWLAPWLVLLAQQDQLRSAAFTDELTGAFNRRYFLRYLAAAIDQARQARHTVTLLYFDVDNFKRYNDQHGHSAGDEILVQTVRLMSACIRPTDRVCRIGGDEFGVIFHDPHGPRRPENRGQGPASIAMIIERFQRQIREHRFPKLMADGTGALTVSGGMATFPWDAQTPESIVEKADQLARQSKQHGKNAITFGPGAERECRRL